MNSAGLCCDSPGGCCRPCPPACPACFDAACRIGRTGRAGRKGVAVTFLTLGDTGALPARPPACLPACLHPVRGHQATSEKLPCFVRLFTPAPCRQSLIKGTLVTLPVLTPAEIFYDLKKFLEESKAPVPPQLAQHEAAKQKPGAIGGGRPSIQFAKK